VKYPSLKKIADLRVGNAAGTVKTPEDVATVCAAASITDLTIGSITVPARPGNIGTTYDYDPVAQASANALGLPNNGIEWYVKNLPAMAKVARSAGKRVRASIAGFTPDEYADMAFALRYIVDELELNLGCPNVWSADGKQKKIPSYDPEALGAILMKVHASIGTSIPVAAKTSPIQDELIKPVARTIATFPMITQVVAVNTVPNTKLLKADGSPALNFKDASADESDPWLHEGGGAGSLASSHMRRVVAGMRYHLPVNVGVIAAGGISSGQDVLDAMNAGAIGFQCATAWIEQSGPRGISQMLEELVSLIPEAA